MVVQWPDTKSVLEIDLEMGKTLKYQEVPAPTTEVLVVDHILRVPDCRKGPFQIIFQQFGKPGKVLEF
jgi:hypothetical protein